MTYKASPSITRLKYECLFLFGVLPLTIALLKPRGLIYWILWIATLACLHTIRKYYGYKFDLDWNVSAFTRDTIRPIFKRFGWLFLVLLAFTVFVIPERFLALPTQRPLSWLMIMVLYPLLSVVPQEIVFRSFFFRRYEKWLNTPKKMAIASALAFGWVHIVLLNWVAVVFSAVGGYLFSQTYQRTKSLALTSFEHALYGCTIFTLGMGYFFYHGHMVR